MSKAVVINAHIQDIAMQYVDQVNKWQKHRKGNYYMTGVDSAGKLWRFVAVDEKEWGGQSASWCLYIYTVESVAGVPCAYERVETDFWDTLKLCKKVAEDFLCAPSNPADRKYRDRYTWAMLNGRRWQTV